MNLAAVVAHYAALLVPGWKVTWSALPPEKMPIKGALAVCNPTPTREMMHLYVVAPWPANESLPETIAHEMTHGMISPLTALLGDNPHAIMTEERIVERLGNLLAQVPAGTARAMARAVTTYAPQLRARLKISAPLLRARDGGNMDPEMIKKAIAAIKAGDGEAALAILEEQLVAGAGGSAEAGPPSAGEPAAKLPVGGPPAPVGEGAPMGRAMARMEAAAKDAEGSATTLRKSAIRARLHEARAIDGATITPEAEKLILAAGSLEDAEIRLTLARGNTGTERARSGVKVGAAKGDGPDLEGLTDREVAMYHSLSKDPESATAYAKEAQRLRARRAVENKGAAS